jgi:long-chain acyl-CoA synthetase
MRAWLERYDPGVPHSIQTYPNKTLVDFVSERAASDPRRTALVFKGRRITYGEIDSASRALASKLVEMGVKPGDRVALLLLNCPQFVITELAAWRIGAIVAPQNPIYTERELIQSLTTSGAQVAVTLSLFYEHLKRCQPSTAVRRVLVSNIKEYLPAPVRTLFTLLLEKKGGHRVDLRDGDERFSDALRGRELREPSLAKPEEPAVILMSGGTTGTPKGVISDHRALVMAGTQLAAWLREAIAERRAAILLPLPLFHAYGCAGAQPMALITGTPLVLVPDPRDSNDLVKTIARERPTLLCAVPPLLNNIVEHPGVASGRITLDSVRACFSGAAALLAEAKLRFEKKTGARVVEGYSLTEATMAACCNPYHGVTKTGSVGMPLPDVTVRIMDADTGRREMPPGETGEVVIGAPQLMRGYWNAASETADVLRVDDHGTWLFTGDLGYLDEDGYLFLVDRKKDLIKTSGYQVWPREIEEVIASFPGVLEVGVAGLPDQRKGEIVAAWVVPQSGVSIDAEKLRSHCREKLAPYKVPSRIEFRESLPKTMIGKILRRSLVAEAKAAAQTAPELVRTT